MLIRTRLRVYCLGAPGGEDRVKVVGCGLDSVPHSSTLDDFLGEEGELALFDTVDDSASPFAVEKLLPVSYHFEWLPNAPIELEFNRLSRIAWLLFR